MQYIPQPQTYMKKNVKHQMYIIRSPNKIEYVSSNTIKIQRFKKTRSPVPDPNSNALTPASLSGKDLHCHGHVARKFKSCDAGKWLRHGNFEWSEGPSFSGRCGA